ncbi:TIGR03032 family protein [Cycloclasticus pugetii]|uniref:TIGR03032 family protein n=1 Tax=Cycloclasticus pugetii TaxID=34068 RepID=UPI003A93F6FA
MSDIGIQSVKQNEINKPRILASNEFSKWLGHQEGSLIFSTYQNSRVIFLSSSNNTELKALDRVVGSAMGIAISSKSLWITNQEQAWKFVNTGTYETVEGIQYDACYQPRLGHFLGQVDTHDVLMDTTFRDESFSFLFVNTAFNCISRLDDEFNFVPIWKPKFITEITQGDRCHVNGMGERDGELRYVTACSQSDVIRGWREDRQSGGVLIDVLTDEILCGGLSMPHSPRFYDGKVYLLNSGKGEFGYVDLEAKCFIPLVQLPGFARGLKIVGGCAVIGLSKLRNNGFSHELVLHDRLHEKNIEQMCGLVVIDLNTQKLVHWLKIEGVRELYDVAFISGITSPYSPGFGSPELHRERFHLSETSDLLSTTLIESNEV